MTSRILVTAAILLTASAAFAADQTWTRAISDKMCGADHTAMRGKATDRDWTLAYTEVARRSRSCREAISPRSPLAKEVCGPTPDRRRGDRAAERRHDSRVIAGDAEPVDFSRRRSGAVQAFWMTMDY